MRNNIITLSGIGIGVFLFAAICVSVVRPALALVDASSSPSAADGSSTVSTAASNAIVIDSASSSDEAIATSTEASASAEQAPTTPAAAPPPIGLTEVHIIGTKYIDYFTDGTTVTAYPGDPAIDSHFSEPNAPIPTHEGLTWVHTTGGYLYDTPSGDLDVGDYAVQSNGSYIQNAHPFVSSTSTPAQTETTTAGSPQASSSPVEGATSTQADGSTSPEVAAASTSTSDSSQSASSTTIPDEGTTPSDERARPR